MKGLLLCVHIVVKTLTFGNFHFFSFLLRNKNTSPVKIKKALVIIYNIGLVLVLIVLGPFALFTSVFPILTHLRRKKKLKKKKKKP